MVMMLVFWVAVTALVVWLVYSIGSDRSAGASPRQPSAEDILDERFARGEIDAGEFARRRESLHGEAHTSQPPDSLAPGSALKG